MFNFKSSHLRLRVSLEEKGPPRLPHDAPWAECTAMHLLTPLVPSLNVYLKVPWSKVSFHAMIEAGDNVIIIIIIFKVRMIQRKVCKTESLEFYSLLEPPWFSYLTRHLDVFIWKTG